MEKTVCKKCGGRGSITCYPRAKVGQPWEEQCNECQDSTAPEKPEKITAEFLKEKYGLVVESTFVPFSQSRHADEKYPSLNWRVTLMHQGKLVLSADYSAGIAHCPGYRQDEKWPSKLLVRSEIQNGKQAFFASTLSKAMPRPGAKTITPDTANVVYSLLIDGEAANVATYEEWALELGYDPDSRKGETVYRQCLETGLRLRNALGDTTLKELREVVFADY